MSHEPRYSDGTFVNLPSGASSDEQRKAGVESYHESWEADLKVKASREGSTTPQIGFQPLRPISSSGPLYAPGPMIPPGFWKWTFILLANALAVWLIVFFCDEYYDRNLQSTYTYYRHDASIVVYGSDYLRIYKPDSRSKFAKVRQGTRLSWLALQQFRHLAINPESYEQDVCSIYGADKWSLLPADLQPQWHVDAKGRCFTDNVEERTLRLVHRNKLLSTFTPIVGGLLLLGLLALNFYIYRMTKED